MPPTPLLLAEASTNTALGAVDWIAIAGYFTLLIGVAWWVIRKNKDTAADYFLAGRNLGWWVIGASVFASNIGSEHIVGLAGSGAQDGVALAHYELHAWCLLVLAWVFVPFYARSRVFTMPEFLERRFSARSRIVLSLVSIVTFIVSKIAVGIFAGGVVFASLLPEMHLRIGGLYLDSFWVGTVVIILLTGLYTTLGGMRAVVYNDAVQVVVLITGSACLTFYGLHRLGGWGELRRLCGSDMFNLWKPLTPPGVQATWAPVLQKDAAGKIVRQAWYFNDNFPWLGMVICAPVIGLWYWCTDQYIVQRVLGAPNETIARRGSLFAGFLKLFPVYLFIIPGMICYALVKANRVPELTAHYDAQGAFPLMVRYLLPPGLRGIVVAGLLSALMSSLAGVFNACSTLFTVDLYEKLRPRSSQRHLVGVGRAATIGMVAISLLWIPVIKGAHGLYDYLQTVQGYLAPPIFVVFFFGVFWKRLNAQGCFWSMVIGLALGIFRMGVDTPVSMGFGHLARGYPSGTFLWVINNINFQYFSIVIMLVSIAVMVGVSYATVAPDYQRLRSLTYATATDEDRSRTRASWSARDVLATLAVLGGISFAYIYFRG